MKRVLVVVDMQEGATHSRYHRQYLNREWWKRHAKVVANIRKLAEKMEVIFQVHTGFRKKGHLNIISGLRDVASGKLVIYKNEDDGSSTLAVQLSRDVHIFACGMNTDACVLKTVGGLKSLGFNVTVVGDACWTAYASKSAHPHDNALRTIRRWGIPVINTKTVR